MPKPKRPKPHWAICNLAGLPLVLDGGKLTLAAGDEHTPFQLKREAVAALAQVVKREGYVVRVVTCPVGANTNLG